MNRVVSEITEMSIKGNLIDNGWYKHLRYENGKVNLNAVVILGEIVYWYRACKRKNEKKGSVVENNQKFKGDKLQKSYLALSEQFGLSKRQVKEACDFLKNKGFITIEYRKVRLSDGRVMSNVMYFEPIVENIKKISCCYESADTEVKGARSNSEEGQVAHFNVIGSSFKSETYTENTTEITTENTTDNYTLCKEIIEYLNLKTGKNYRGFAKSTQKLIKDKVIEGYNKGDLFKVIDKKVDSWGGTIYEKYLRPTTLFGDKFDEYLNEEIKNYREVRSFKKSSFCDFNQRPYDGSDGGYDLKELEKKLLDW